MTEYENDGRLFGGQRMKGESWPDYHERMGGQSAWVWVAILIGAAAWLLLR